MLQEVVIMIGYMCLKWGTILRGISSNVTFAVIIFKFKHFSYFYHTSYSIFSLIFCYSNTKLTDTPHDLTTPLQSICPKKLRTGYINRTTIQKKLDPRIYNRLINKWNVYKYIIVIKKFWHMIPYGWTSKTLY